MKTYDLASGLAHWTIEATDIDDAMAQADECIAYNQEDMVISQDGVELTRRRWYGCEDGKDACIDAIGFGQFGYYGDWEELPKHERRCFSG